MAGASFHGSLVNFGRFVEHPQDLREIDSSISTESTPKQASVGGVMFYRSKNGNLYRSGLVKAQK